MSGWKTLCLLLVCLAGATWPCRGGWKAGCAQVDITPGESVWMGGYAFRTGPSQGIRQDLRAKALVLEDEGGQRAVLVTLDILSIPKPFSDRVRDAVGRTYGLDRSRIILNASHTHSGPVLDDALPYIYPMDRREWKKVHRYTEQLERAVVALVDAAMGDLRPARLAYGRSLARFAVNRRNNAEKDLLSSTEIRGPSDHAVPVLQVEGLDGQVRVLLFGYACHNTVLSDYLFGGDFAGCAQEEVERLYPGALAMFFQGAGGDQNPMPRRLPSLAVQYGKELAGAVQQAVSAGLTPLEGGLDARYVEVRLPLESPDSLAALDRLGQGTDYRARWARNIAAKVRKGESLPAEYPYPVTYWRLGNLDLFALGGELTVAYAIEIKRHYGQDTVVMGYSNDVMSYIPSTVIWDEGGYEGAVAHMVYGLPARWERDVQTRIMDAVLRLVPPPGDHR